MEVLQDTYKDTKIGRIPKDWEILRLGEVCLKIRDGNYGGSYPKANEFLNSGVPFLTSASIGGGNFIIKKKIKFISPEKHSELTKAHIKFGDVLFTNRGANVGSVALVKQELDDANIGPQLTYLRCKLDVIDNQYLFNLMQSNSFQKQVKSLDNGTAMNFFGIGTTKTFKLPIPTLPEQQKIAAILSTVDEQISTTDKIIEKSKELKKGLMQKLFSEGIGHTEFKDTKIGRIPKDWEMVRLGGHSKLLTGGTPNTKVEEYWDGDIPWMASGDISKKYIEDVEGRITELGLQKSAAKFIPVNSIFIALNGQGKTKGTVAISLKEVTCNQSLAAYVLSEKSFIPLFVFFYLTTRYWHLRALAGGDDRAGLNLGLLRTVKCPLPTLPEQQKIAAILSEADAKIEKEQTQKTQLKTLKKGLMQQLLTGKKRVKV
jgi:type I restriction enzyme S subunit